ncbi:MAG: heavy-metal-associated domain-containing protein, partial [Actinomycetota bacterium]|nr:heavy-metal-associated domain-containing protein [Actinomycetota bacterium]
MSQSTVEQPVVEFDVGGMTCGSCAIRVQRVLAKQPGVEQAEVNFANGKAHVRLADPDADLEALRAAVAKIDYELREPRQEPEEALGDEEALAERSWLRRVLITWPLALVVAYLAMFSGSIGEQPWAHWTEFA